MANAAEAMKFYQSGVGGDPNIQTFGEAGMAQSDLKKTGKKT
jgi:hypothetical protein